MPRAASLLLLVASAALALGALGCESCAKNDAQTSEGGGGDPDPAAMKEAGALNATPLPSASVAALVNPSKLPAYSGPVGSIEGMITVTGDPPPATPGDFAKCPAASLTWGKKFREGPEMAPGVRALADAIVVVTGYKGFYVPEKREAKEVVIEDCAYTTRTATMTFGQRLDVKNNSKDFWTPMLEPGSTMILMMATPKGDPAKMYPKRPGHYLLVDRDRRYSVVDVYAFLHPHHASSDQFGHYRIDGIPVGKLRVSTTHPQIDDSAEKDVEIVADVVTKVDLTVKNVNRDAGASPPPSGDAAVPPVH